MSSDDEQIETEHKPDAEQRQTLSFAEGDEIVGSRLVKLRANRPGVAGTDRIGLRLVDADGVPLSDTTITVRLMRDDDEALTVETHTGPTGYAKLDLSRVDTSAITGVVVGSPKDEFPAKRAPPESILTDHPLTLDVETVLDDLDRPVKPLDHVPDQVFTEPPEPADVEHAPELFNPTVEKDDGSCSIDFTAKVDVHEKFFNQLVRVDSLAQKGPSQHSRELLTDQVPFELTPKYGDDQSQSEPYLERVSEPSLGVLNVYKQSWTRVGHGLGKLLHSLTLAPCESTNVAIVDWTRTEAGSRWESSTAREQQDHSLQRDRLIEEIVDATVSENQWGESSSVQGGGGISGGLAGIGKGILGAIGISIGGGAASSSSSSGGRREISASTVQNLSDSVVQHASAMRSLRSSVVTQSRQAEREEIETRTVENHNRNHAMTVQYFQMLEHYTVSTELVEETEVLFVPYEIPAALWEEMPSFDRFVLTMAEVRRLLADVPETVADQINDYAPGIPDAGEVQPVLTSTAQAAVQSAVADAIDDVVTDPDTLLGLDDSDETLATSAWSRLEHIADFPDFGGIGPDEADSDYSAADFDEEAFKQTVLSTFRDATRETNPRKRSDLVGWLDRNAEQLRAIAPTEYDDAFEALSRLVRTPEVYQTSEPQVTASRWTIELREAWQPSLTIAVHTTDGQVVTLNARHERDGSAVTMFTSAPVPVSKIDSLELIYAPEEAKETVLERVANVDSGTEAVLDELFGDDESPFKEEIEQAKTFDLSRLRVTVHTDPSDEHPRRESHQLVDLTESDIEDGDINETLSASDPSTVVSNLRPPEPDILETKTRRYEDYSAVQEFVSHLQANRMAYLRTLWLREDADRRALRFDRYSFPMETGWGGVEQRPLLELIENEPVGVVGNAVAFRLLEQGQLDQSETLDVDLETSKLVSLPTKGVYAETLLSHCNATEVRDLDRVPIDDQTCGSEAPPIEGVSPGSRRADVDTTPVGPPESTISMQEAPPAPNPVGMQSALETLATPEIFRDMSLGSETVEAANSLAQQAMEESGDARQQTLQALTSLLDSAGEGSGTDTSSPTGDDPSSAVQSARDAIDRSLDQAATEAHRQSDPVTNRDHQRNIDDALEEGRIDEEAHQRASERLHNASSQPSGEEPDVDPVKQRTLETTDEWVEGEVLLADFAIDDDSLRPEHETYLAEHLVPNLGSSGRIPLIRGHTSESGPAEHNQTLSEERAEAVKSFLVEETPIEDHQILDVFGVGETQQFDAEGPLEDPAERSVVLKYESYQPVPELTEPPEAESDPDEGYTEWEIRLKYERTENSITDFISDPVDEFLEMFEQNVVELELRPVDASDTGTLDGIISFKGIEVGLWLSTDTSSVWTEWQAFETEAPMSPSEWDGVRANLQFGSLEGGTYTSQIDVMYLSLDPAAGVTDTVELGVTIKEGDNATGVEINRSLLPGQLWLADE